MQFQYVAYNLDAGIVKGKLEAEDESEARAELSGQGYKTLSITRPFEPPKLEKILPSLLAVKQAELIAMCRQASTMLAGGSSLLRVLEMLGSEASGRGMQHVLADLYKKVSEGDSLTSALREHPKVFDEVFTALVEVGEYTGSLAPALEQLADIMAQEHEAKARAQKALMMPIFLIGSSMVMLGFMVFVALPPLIDTFEKMDVAIPAATLLMINGTQGFVHNIVTEFVIFAMLYGSYKFAQRFGVTRYWTQYGKLKIPIMGKLILTSELGRFSRVTGTLLGSGVDIPAALHLGIGAAKNAAIKEAWIDAERNLIAGTNVAETLRNHKAVPSLFVELVAIGEESNTLPRTLNELADNYQKQFEDGIDALLAIAEPVSTMTVGGLILFMMLSVLKPILSTVSTLAP